MRNQTKKTAPWFFVVMAISSLLLFSARRPTWRENSLLDMDQTTYNVPARSFDLAFRESLGFFDDIDEASWRLLKEGVRSSPLFIRPDNPENGMDKTALWMMFNVDPIFNCQHARRIGGLGDGPKWVCDPHRLKKVPDCLVYSVGSFGIYMFEDGLIQSVGNKHCEIHVFDPNIKYARANDITKNNIHYHAWGLKSSYSDSFEFGGFKFMSLGETLEQLGHTDRRIDLFKIDCEGCEWTSYKDWINESVDIRQIQIEVHASTRRPQDVPVSGFFQDLFDRGFVPFSKEANTHPAASPRGTLFEYGFIRLDKSFFVS